MARIENTALGGITKWSRAALVAGLAVWTWRFARTPIGLDAIDSFLHLPNLIFHEAGHIIFGLFGQFMAALGGSLLQVLIPVIAATSFMRQDPPQTFGAAICAWWAGQNLVDLAPYIADSRSLQIVLLGGKTGAEVEGHDWEYLLTQLGILHLDHTIGRWTHAIGLIIMRTSLAFAVQDAGEKVGVGSAGMTIPSSGRSGRTLPGSRTARGSGWKDFQSKRPMGQAPEARGPRDVEAGLQAAGGDLQERLYAQDQWSVLLIFQAMDAAGKDSAIKHVMSGVNPQGCEVHSFKGPSTRGARSRFPVAYRRARCRGAAASASSIARPPRRLSSYGCTRTSSRSGPPPSEVITKNIWRERFKIISAWERYLSPQGVVVRKFFLHVSKEEQRPALLQRLEQPEKNWKFSPADVAERKHFAEYMNAYEDMIRHTP